MSAFVLYWHHCTMRCTSGQYEHAVAQVTVAAPMHNADELQRRARQELLRKVLPMVNPDRWALSAWVIDQAEVIGCAA